MQLAQALWMYFLCSSQNHAAFCYNHAIGLQKARHLQIPINGKSTVAEIEMLAMFLRELRNLFIY